MIAPSIVQMKSNKNSLIFNFFKYTSKISFNNAIIDTNIKLFKLENNNNLKKIKKIKPYMKWFALSLFIETISNKSFKNCLFISII